MDVGDKVKLEPCPFCGSTDIAHETFDEGDSRDFVMCNGCGVFAQRNDCEAEPVEVWNRRTPSASIGEDGLPELPKAAHRGPDGTGSYFDSYTADQMRQYACEAVAADRRARDVVPKAARGVEIQAMADCMDMVRQELIEAGVIDKSVPPMMIADAVVAQFAATTANLQTAVQQAWKANAELSKLRAEIDDLRAQLAHLSQEKPVAWLEAEPSARGRPAHEVIFSVVYSSRIHTKCAPMTSNPVWPLYAAPPLSSEPQTETGAA